MKVFLPFLLFFLVVGTASASVEFIDVKDVSTWEKMLELARATNKQVFLYLHDQNCRSCFEMRKETFKDKTLSRYINTYFLALEVNASTVFGQGIVQLYSVTDVPACLTLNAYELIFDSITGKIEPAALQKRLEKSLDDINRYPRWAKGAAAGTLPKNEYIQYLLIENKNKRVTANHPIIRDLSTLLDSIDFADTYVLAFVQELCISIDGPMFLTLLKKPNWITESANFSWTAYQENVYNYNIGLAITNKDSVYLEESLRRIAQMPAVAPIPLLAFKGRQLYLAELNKWSAYDTITLAYLDTLPADSANAYQREAIHLMEFYTNGQAKSIALKYLRKGIARKETFDLYYTLSLWLYQNGDYTNAYKAAYTAENLAKNTDEKRLAQIMQKRIEQVFY